MIHVLESDLTVTTTVYTECLDELKGEIIAPILLLDAFPYENYILKPCRTMIIAQHFQPNLWLLTRVLNGQKFYLV
jgi:hypothetical protein